MNILQMATQLLGQLHLTEHDLLMIALGVIVGMTLVGGGVHRRAYSAVRRLRPW